MADNMGKITKFPRYDAEGARDSSYELEGCVCHECRRQRRRSSDRADAGLIARRITLLCLCAAVIVGVFYGVTHV